MVKIKTKKKMNLPQLIEWAWDNDVKRKAFHSNVTGGSVYFDEECFVYVEHEADKSDLFTVEVEEEITEDTVIDEMLLVFNNGVTHLVENRSLNYLDTSCLKSAYSMNDDLRLILIWRDGKLVE